MNYHRQLTLVDTNGSIPVTLPSDVTPSTSLLVSDTTSPVGGFAGHNITFVGFGTVNTGTSTIDGPFYFQANHPEHTVHSSLTWTLVSGSSYRFVVASAGTFTLELYYIAYKYGILGTVAKGDFQFRKYNAAYTTYTVVSSSAFAIPDVSSIADYVAGSLAATFTAEAGEILEVWTANKTPASGQVSASCRCLIQYVS